MMGRLGVLALIVLVGCKGPGFGGVTLTDAPPPTVPADWVSIPADVEGYTMSFPPGWEFQHMSASDLEGYVKSMNENAWEMLNQKKADVDFSKAQALKGARDNSILSFFEENRTEAHMLIAIREDLGKKLSLKQAADRWRDTVRLEGEQNPPKEGSAKLPVGDATVLYKSNTVMNETERITVYVLVDGTVQYTFFFGEAVSRNAQSIPHKEIMETFRVKK